jgi:hypothetical protein
MPVTLSPYALTTLEMAKVQLSIPPATTTYDDVIKRFINEATGRIETFCDRKLKQRTGIVEIQDGFANDRILLDQWPATKPTQLWIDPTGLFTDTTYQLAAADFALDVSARGEGIGVVLTGNCRFFPRGTKNVKAVYDGGFATIPDELEGACLWTVAFLYDMRNNQSVGKETVGKNQENTTYRSDLPDYVMTTLLAYKRAEWPTGDRMLSTR